MHKNTNFRNLNELLPGDVILCYCDPSKDLIAKAIHSVTASDYSHAAIYYGGGFAAESRAKNGSKKGGIEKVKIDELVGRYSYVAVLRQPDAWATEDRVLALQEFIDRVIASGSKYNFSGVFKFKHRREFHQSNSLEKLKQYFDGKLTPLPAEKSTYFCSEFVCDCFIAVGFISQSAAVVFQSDTYSPGDLCTESAFGFFWGYASTKEAAQQNKQDYFYRVTTYDTLFGQSSVGA